MSELLIALYFWRIDDDDSMKKILLLLSFFIATNSLAENRKLICDTMYVTEDEQGRRVNKYLPEGHAESVFENRYHSASIMKRTKDLVDLTVYVDRSKIQASLAYLNTQTSYGGPIKDNAPFTLNLFYREKKVQINGDLASSLYLQCLIN